MRFRKDLAKSEQNGTPPDLKKKFPIRFAQVQTLLQLRELGKDLPGHYSPHQSTTMSKVKSQASGSVR